MKGLDLRKYIAVPFEEEEVYPWLADEAALDRILANAAYVKKLRLAFQSASEQPLLNTIMFNEAAPLPPITLDECTHYLGLLSRPVPNGGFVFLDEQQRANAHTHVALLSERFYGGFYQNLGSSRHAILKDSHIKGVGLNSLAQAEDYHHRWGGFIVRDALKSFLSDIVVNKRTRLGSLRCLAGFVYRHKLQGRVPLCLQLREADSFRLGQLHPHFLTDADVQVARKHLEHFFHGANPAVMLEQILEHYVHAASVGIFHRSPTFDNLLIDGRFVDCESIDFTLDARPIPKFLFVSVKTDGKGADFAFDDLAGALSMTEDFAFVDSSLHTLYRLGRLTEVVYRSLYDGISFDLHQSLHRLVDRYLPGFYGDADWELLKDIRSSGERALLSDRVRDAEPIQKDRLKLWGHFKFIHYYDEPLAGRTVLMFFEDTSRDLRLECNEILRKWEVAFWTSVDTSDWSSAFQRYQKMQVSIE